MGVIKPWAPPRSYGLVIRLERHGAPLYSLHSRVDGNNHGVVAAIEVRRRALRARQGPGRLLRCRSTASRRSCAHERPDPRAAQGDQEIYAGVPAIEDVDFALRRGEIHALVGENGAGKSTLTKVMAGVVTLTSGRC